MATIPYQPPRLVETGSVLEPNIYNIPAAGGQTLTEGDFATIAAGVLSKSAANPTAASLAGLVRAGNDSVYHTSAPSKTTLFGFDQTGTALIPGTNQNPQVIGLGAGVEIEISLNQATTLAQTLVGTAVGLNYDATSGFFFADGTQANKPFTIVAISAGPDAAQSGFQQASGVSNGVLGDLGGRVIIQANTALALV